MNGGRGAWRVALVTGGGTGIGRGIALTLARRGVAVALVGRRLEPLTATAADLHARGGQAIALVADLTDAPARRRAIGGREWAYMTAGTGTDWVVLLPGALGVADTAFHYILALAARYRVLSLDYPPTIDRVAPLLADMAALLTAEGATRVHLVGGSYSGPIAHAFAQCYPAQVRSLILANTALPHRRRLLGGRALLLVLAILPTPILQGLLQGSIRWFLPTGTTLERFWRAYFGALLPTLSRQWLINRVRIFLELTARGPERSAWVGPVLIVDARQETLFTAPEQAALWAFYPQAEAVTINMVGHGSALKALDAHIVAYAAFLERAATDR